MGFKYKRDKGSWHTVMGISLFIFFVGCTVMMIFIGANVYKKINLRTENNFNRRTPCTYIATKVRQADQKDGITIINKEGIDILILKEEIQGGNYETWIYAYQGELREVLLEKGQTIDLEQGQTMMPIESVKFEEINKKLIKVTCSCKDEEAEEIFLNIRTQLD